MTIPFKERFGMSNRLARLRLRLPWLAVPVIFLFDDPTLPELVAGASLAIAGLLIRAWAAGTIEKNRVLTVSGPYAFTRNPLYLGSFLIGIGVTISTGRPIFVLAAVLFFAVIYTRTIAGEQQKLETLYGNAFREYCRAVPAVLPRLTPYRPADHPKLGFAIDRYRRHREYQAALGVLTALAMLTAELIW